MTPDRWLGIVVPVPSAGLRALVADELVGMGARAVVEDGASLVTHFPPPRDLLVFLASLEKTLHVLTGSPVSLRWHWQSHEEWADSWRWGLGCTRVSRRITVAPTWDVPSRPVSEVLVTLDPGMAFGTAGHASTRSALRLLDNAVRRGRVLADIGTGSGILAIAAAKLGAAQVLAVDADPLACAAARENVRENGVARIVRVRRERASPEWVAARRPLDGIMANIESGVLTELLPGFAAALAPRGWLAVSGILADESGDFAYAAARHGFRLADDDAEDGWWAGTFTPALPGPTP